MKGNKVNLQTFGITVRNDIDFDCQVLNKMIIFRKNGNVETVSAEDFINKKKQD